MVQFKVNDVEPDLNWVNERLTVDGSQQAKDLARAKAVEGFSHRGATFVSDRSLGTKNPLIAAVYQAFAHHLPLTLSPDVIWNTIMQGVSTHVSKDPEKHRHTFVSHKGRETLQVCDDSLHRGSPANDWGRMACRFTDLIAARLSGKAALQALHTRFTTTDDMARVAHAIVFMDVVKSYFEYRCSTACGIPSIELTGTKEDWSHMRSALAILDELELTSWRTQLDSILSHFEGAFDNRVEQSFWNDIFLKHGAFGSGGVTTISGWIGALFLYVGGKRNPVALGKSKVRLDPEDFASGLCETPFVWEYSGAEFDMLLRGGLVGVVVDPVSHAVAPQLGWLVTDAADDPALKPRHEFPADDDNTGTEYTGYTEADEGQVYHESEESLECPSTITVTIRVTCGSCGSLIISKDAETEYTGYTEADEGLVSRLVYHESEVCMERPTTTAMRDICGSCGPLTTSKNVGTEYTGYTEADEGLVSRLVHHESEESLECPSTITIRVTCGSCGSLITSKDTGTEYTGYTEADEGLVPRLVHHESEVSVERPTTTTMRVVCGSCGSLTTSKDTGTEYTGYTESDEVLVG